ncbi:hypothetical protein [Nocardioides sp.]|uniref:hypothetical protein n=1 Tax=Nocardioides sp. TaxID=35761 RepID=UPI002C0A6784|nr:hypothetical protein [Nocardioides sp.]HXH79515.1 hypothetical protein [Nocardioides sp.]
MDDQPMGAKAQAAARAAARQAGIASPPSADDPVALSPQLDAAVSAQRLQSSAIPPPAVAATAYGQTITDIRLGWYPVFELAFKFTVAFAVIGVVPFLIVLFLLTR